MIEFRKLMVANRGEIAIRVFRSAHELGIGTVAIYSHEDRFSLHRLKADEAYQVGKAGEPIRSYLDIEAIVALAQEKEVDAIHPGYGFLSENAEFARACRKAGIIFVGPRPELLELLGDKVAARALAREAGVPILSGSDTPVVPGPEAHAVAEALGYPVIVKAAMGGGGRGMRVVEEADALDPALDQAAARPRTRSAAPTSSSRSSSAGPSTSRCSSWAIITAISSTSTSATARSSGGTRRSSRSPRPAASSRRSASPSAEAALAIGGKVGYENAGTVEFLVDDEAGTFSFIEVNPRLQVEHTVTELVTGIDIVKSQILIAQGRELADPDIGIAGQESIPIQGHAIQCRITSEDPTNNFTPDYGRITHYRSSGGPGTPPRRGHDHDGRHHHAVL